VGGGGLKLADRVHPVSEFSQLNQVGPGKVAGGELETLHSFKNRAGLFQSRTVVPSNKTSLFMLHLVRLMDGRQVFCPSTIVACFGVSFDGFVRRLGCLDTR
jgi:hypothetical protein